MVNVLLLDLCFLFLIFAAVIHLVRSHVFNLRLLLILLIFLFFLTFIFLCLLITDHLLLFLLQVEGDGIDYEL